jgi:hypothetical protein
MRCYLGNTALSAAAPSVKKVKINNAAVGKNLMISIDTETRVAVSHYPNRARWSFKMHRSITTKMPFWRAFSAARSLITSSCSQMAGTFN